MQPVGISGGQDDGAGQHDDVLAGHDSPTRTRRTPSRPAGAAARSTAVSSSRGMPALMTCLRRRSMNGTPELPCTLAATLRILPGLVTTLPCVVAPQIKPGLLQLRVVDVLDPLAASPRPVLIDQKLVVILDEELGRVARLLVGVAERAAGQHQIAGEDRGAALADQSLADDDRLNAVHDAD